MNKKNWIMITSLILFTFLAYGNALFNGFVMDDKVFIVENPYIKDFKYLPDLFQKRLGELSSWGRDFESYYRPLFLLSFMMDYHFWGLNPQMFHLQNILWHLICTILVFYFARRIVNSDFFAYVSALLFCLHPIHTEAVTPVFNRMDPFVTSCMLGSFLCFAYFLNSRQTKLLFYVGSLLLFLIALFAKELVIMLPIVLLTYDYIFYEKSLLNIWRKKWLYYFGFGAIFLFYLIFRILVLGPYVAGYLHQPMYTSFALTNLPVLSIYIVFKALFFYISKLVLPINLNIVYYFILDRYFNPEVILAIILGILSLCYALRYKSRNPIIAFFILWFFITIFPVSQIIPYGNLVAEHYTYVPSIGFCCLLAYGIYILHNKCKKSAHPWLHPRIVSLLLVFVCSFYLYQTVVRNYDWRNDFTIWRASAKLNTPSPKPYSNLANAYMERGDLNEAGRLYLKALSIQPFNPPALNSLGALYVRRGDFEKGLSLMKKALRIQPESSLAYRNIGRTYNLMKDYKKAIHYLQLARSLNPGRLELYYDLGLAYVNSGDYDKAIEEFDEALSLDQNYAHAYYGLGLVHYRQDKKQDANVYFQKAIFLEPNFRFALKALQ